MNVITDHNLPNGNIVDALTAAAHQSPDRAALYSWARGASPGHIREERFTFAELEANVCRLASSLHSRGIVKNDRVVVMIPMSPELYIVVLALMRLAATPTFVESYMDLRQMVSVCEMSDPKAFVATPKAHLLRLFSRKLRAAQLICTTSHTPLPGAETISALLRENATNTLTARPDEDTPALINFTSGTSGEPRGVIRTHRYLWAQHLALVEAFPFEASDVDMSAFPVFPLHSIASGIPTILPAMFSGVPAQVVPGAVVKQIQDQGVTAVKGSPGFFQAIASYCNERSITFRSVRAILTGGAPVHADLVRSLKKLLPNGEVYLAYGSTEVEPIAGITGSDMLEHTWHLTLQGRGNCVGAPLGTVEVRVIKCLDSSLNLASNEWDYVLQTKGVPGEVVVKGELANSSYFRNSQATEDTKFSDDKGGNWHRTGDAGYLDDSGRLWLVGRMANKVIRNGCELYPLQIEPVVNALSFVDRCALLGFPGTGAVQRSVLVVAPKSKSILRRLTSSLKWRKEVDLMCGLHDFPVDEILFKRNVPLDRRRRAKVDYKSLRGWYRRPALLRLLG